MSDLTYPLTSLTQGHWFKLICGASFQHLPAVRNITLAYALAGADCIDVAADPAVIAAAKEALQVSGKLVSVAQKRGYVKRKQQQPLLMVSLNDGEDPHFRKAEFDPSVCPADCSRPCEQICPAQAIIFEEERGQVSGQRERSDEDIILSMPPGFLTAPETVVRSGVIEERCYGCGRCVPVCPIGQIVTRSYVSTPLAIAPIVFASGVDAVEIHTQVGRLEDFKRLWSAIAPWVNRLRVVAISCPDGDGLIDYLWAVYQTISPLPFPLIWQTDGRPMSGDIGTGTTRAAVKLGQKVLAAGLPGYVQLAGGTNHHTVAKLQAAGLLKSLAELEKEKNASLLQSGPVSVPPGCQSFIAGVAYGSYARVLLSPVLEQLEQRTRASLQQKECLEESPDLLWQAVDLAYSLVSQLKFPLQSKYTTSNTLP